LKLPTAISNGLFPTPKLVAGPNVPVPVPKSIETLLELVLATAKSNIVSPLKSPIAVRMEIQENPDILFRQLTTHFIRDDNKMRLMELLN
jgi:hypothetical protein